MPKLIGIGGKLRSGKDTIADHLVLDYDWIKMGMSEPLLDASLILNPWIRIDNPNEWYTENEFVKLSDLIESAGYTKAKEQEEYRVLLQKLGTEVGRHMIGENTWVDIAARDIIAHLGEGRDVIITGIRYQNELDMIRRLGGEAWWVERPGLKTIEASAHSSENGVVATDFDLMLMNVGTLTQLYAQVEREIQE